MNKLIVGGLAAILGTSTVLATGAFAGQPDGQGAQRSGLSTDFQSNSAQCGEASGAQTNGFAILNTAGKVGSAVLTNGEVSLKGATPDTDYVAYIAESGTCTVMSALHTNHVGNGNAHLQTTPGLAGSDYYVVIQLDGQEVYASGPMTLE